MVDYIFGKFMKDEGWKRRRYKLAVEHADIEAWNGDIKTRSKAKRSNKASGGESRSERSQFYRINAEIFETLIAFYDIAPMTLSVSSMYPNMIIDKEIVPVFQKHGELISEDESQESYKLDFAKYSKLNNGLNKLSSSSSMALLFPRFFIIGLVSIYDSFIYNLAKAVIEARPEIVFNSERNISFAEINKYENISEIKEYIIDAEVENLLRENHEEQLKWFSKKLGMKVEPEKSLYVSFVEICERRNLFTHTGGRVTTQYLSKCRDAGCDVAGVKVGENLHASQKYFQQSVETIIEVAVQLVHVVWQKIEKEGGKEASKALVDITYNLISEERYDLAIRIIDFILGNKSTKMVDSTRKMHIVNVCNAMKLAGKSGYLDKIDAEDWSAATLDYKLSVAAIKGDQEAFLYLLPKAVKSEAVTKQDIRQWPVFRNMRGEKRVIEQFEELFGEPLFEEKAKL